MLKTTYVYLLIEWLITTTSWVTVTSWLLRLITIWIELYRILSTYKYPRQQKTKLQVFEDRHFFKIFWLKVERTKERPSIYGTVPLPLNFSHTCTYWIPYTTTTGRISENYRLLTTDLFLIPEYSDILWTNEHRITLILSNFPYRISYFQLYRIPMKHIHMPTNSPPPSAHCRCPPKVSYFQQLDEYELNDCNETRNYQRIPHSNRTNITSELPITNLPDEKLTKNW